MHQQNTSFSSILVFALTLTMPALGDDSCELGWLPGDGVPGVSHDVSAMLPWQPGDGSLPEVLVVTGGFNVAGTKVVNGIAAWDGTEWYALGEGAGGGPLAAYEGDLVSSGLGGVARWDGTSWHLLGGDANGLVRALSVFGDDLIAAGQFTMIGDVPVERIARWDGAAWHPFGAGMNGAVQALAVYNGNLIAGGSFLMAGGIEVNRIARWDGMQWHALGTGVTQGGGGVDVRSLAEFGGDLFIGGNFSVAGGQEIQSLARWDGQSWHDVGAPGVVNSLVTVKDKLIAGGTFGSIGGVPAESIAYWNGVEWTRIVPGPGLTGYVRAAAEFEGVIYAGSDSLSGYPLTRIKRWHGSEWHHVTDLGMNGPINAFTQHDGHLVAVGSFSHASNGPASRVARWNGDVWEAIGNEIAQGHIYAAAEFNGDIIVGGRFWIDGVLTRVARWDGLTWTHLGNPDWGAAGTVYTLTVFNGDLIVGGNFTSAGGWAINVARWDGTLWHSIGSPGNTVNALAVYDGQLFAGGQFSINGTWGAAVWTGFSWSHVGTGLGGSVRALAVYDGEMIAGGTFTSTDGAGLFDRIARWDGTSWKPLGSGMNHWVNALTVFDSPAGTGPSLYVGGSFTLAGGASTKRVAEWDGDAWHALGSGVNPHLESLFVGGSVKALGQYQGQLVVGGEFSIAGGEVSAYFARWGCIEPPCIPADLNCDGVVGVADLLILLAAWGPCPDCTPGTPGNCPADLDNDCNVGVPDLLILLANWG